MKLKKVILIIIAVIIVIGIICVFAFSGKNSNSNNDGKINIVSSNFASYDFARAIAKGNDKVEVKFLLGPGKDSHSYEPTAADLITLQNSDLFIYIGGDSEKWCDKVLDSLDTSKTKKMCIADFVDKLDEEEIDGAEVEDEEDEDGAFDDHIWTSPLNSIKMVEAIEKELESIDSENASIYKENADKYIAQIKDVDAKIQDVVDHKVRDRLVFADKMPMQYFINYYGLKVSAAFNGCSTETEPSASTIAYLEDVVKKEKIPVILCIELNPGRVAETIANEVGNGCKTMQIQSLHNVSLDDFNNGETWVSLMTRNIEVLKAALQ